MNKSPPQLKDEGSCFRRTEAFVDRHPEMANQFSVVPGHLEFKSVKSKPMKQKPKNKAVRREKQKEWIIEVLKLVNSVLICLMPVIKPIIIQLVEQTMS
jgi:hypothetical protein